MSESTSAELNLLDCVIYTNNTRIAGKFQTAHGRVSDALNLPDAEFMVMQQVGVQSLLAKEDGEMQAASIMLRRANAILVALAQQASDASRSDRTTTASRDLRQTTIEAGPFTVSGTVHVPPGGDMLQYVTEGQFPFVAATDASVVYRPDPEFNFTAPFVMVNRSWIGALLEGAQVTEPQARKAGQRASTGASAAAPAQEDVSDLGKAAGEVLLATQVFSGADIAGLERALTQLSQSGGVARKHFYAGSEVFREGDHADSLYVVATGTLEVVARDRLQGGARRVAELKNGDVFGEVALLGEGRRTASVIGTSSGTLYEIKESALKQLVSLFPTATSTLLKVMVQRRGPRGAGPARFR